ARLSFDQRYQFEEQAFGPLATAGDGGVVEAQAFDEATGTYGPWRLLFNGTQPPRLVVYGAGLADPAAFARMGYSALYRRGAGWTVANLKLSGTVFHGAPVLLRLRAASDGSVLEGNWNLAGIEVSGGLYQRKLAVTGSDPAVLVRVPAAGEPVIPVRVRNLGT